MTDIGFHAANGTSLRRAAALRKNPRQGTNFNGIADRRAGAMGFHIADLLRRNARLLIGLAQHGFLAFRRGRHDADGTPIIIHCHGVDHRLDAVAIRQRLRQALEHDQPAALARHHAIGAGIESAAQAGGRQCASLRQQFVGTARRQQIHATGQGQFAVTQ